MYPIPSAPPWFPLRLQEYCLQYGISLNPHAVDILTHHAEWLVYWNQKTNLTGLTSWEKILISHYMDSLIPTPWLPGCGKALDIGSGAGFPGLPIKVIRDGLEMVLCDTRRKKISFLKTFLAHIRLQRITLIYGHWQTAILGITGQEAESRNKFELITSRALRLSSRDIEMITIRGLKPGGVLALWGNFLSIPRLSIETTQRLHIETKNYELPDGTPRSVVFLKSIKNIKQKPNRNES